MIKMIKSVLLLTAMLAIALSTWGSGFETWDELFVPMNFFVGMGIAGPVVIAWLAKSPIKPKE